MMVVSFAEPHAAAVAKHGVGWVLGAAGRAAALERRAAFVTKAGVVRIFVLAASAKHLPHFSALSSRRFWTCPD